MGEAPITSTGGRDYMPASSAIQKQLQDPNLKPMGIADLTPPTLPLVPPGEKQATQPSQGAAPQGVAAAAAAVDPRMSAPQINAPNVGIPSAVEGPGKIQYKDPYSLPEAYDINRERDRLYRANLKEFGRDPMAEMRAGRKDAAEFLRRDEVRKAAMGDIDALKALDERQAKERGGISALSRYLLRSPNQSTAFGRLGRSVIQGQETAQMDERNRLLELQKMRRAAEEADRLRADRAAQIGEGIRTTGEEAKRIALTSATGMANQFANELSERARGMLEADKANLSAASAASRDRMQLILGKMKNQTAVDIANLESKISMIRDATDRKKISEMSERNRLELLRLTTADAAKLDSTYAKLAADAVENLKLTEDYMDASKEGREKLERKERELIEQARRKAAKENRELIQRLKGGLAEGFTSTERSS
jgi:hypothetical protein